MIHTTPNKHFHPSCLQDNFIAYIVIYRVTKFQYEEIPMSTNLEYNVIYTTYYLPQYHTVVFWSHDDFLHYWPFVGAIQR